LPVLDKKLAGSKYLVDSDYTIVDIQIYNEITQVLKLQKKGLEADKLVKLSAWYDKMSKLPEI
jgi:glutathione S-transferase